MRKHHIREAMEQMKITGKFVSLDDIIDEQLGSNRGTTYLGRLRTGQDSGARFGEYAFHVERGYMKSVWQRCNAGRAGSTSYNSHAADCYDPAVVCARGSMRVVQRHESSFVIVLHGPRVLLLFRASE